MKSRSSKVARITIIIIEVVMYMKKGAYSGALEGPP